MCRYRLGEYEGALKMFEVAANVDPGDSRVFHNWGLTLWALLRYEEAAEKYERAIKLDAAGKFPTTHNNLGRVYEKLYRYEDAIKHFEIASGGWPHDGDGLLKAAYARNWVTRS